MVVLPFFPSFCLVNLAIQKNGRHQPAKNAGLWAFLDPSVLPGMEIPTLLGGTVAAAGLGLVVTSQVPFGF